MGKHTAKPEKIGQKIRKDANLSARFIWHVALDIPAALISILIFEAYRSGWLELLGHSTQIH